MQAWFRTQLRAERSMVIQAFDEMRSRMVRALEDHHSKVLYELEELLQGPLRLAATGVTPASSVCSSYDENMTFAFPPDSSAASFRDVDGLSDHREAFVPATSIGENPVNYAELHRLMGSMRRDGSSGSRRRKHVGNTTGRSMSRGAARGYLAATAEVDLVANVDTSSVVGSGSGVAKGYMGSDSASEVSASSTEGNGVAAAKLDSISPSLASEGGPHRWRSIPEHAMINPPSSPGRPHSPTSNGLVNGSTLPPGMKRCQAQTRRV